MTAAEGTGESWAGAVQLVEAPDGKGDAEAEERPPWLPEASGWEAAEPEETRGPAWAQRHNAGRGGGEPEVGAGDEGEQELVVAEGEWDPRYFLGGWTDNLGHRIMVAPSEQRGGRRRGKGRNSGPPKLSFLAVMQKVGVPEKRFTISKDRWSENWICGNGSLVVEDSTSEAVVWMTEDGRKSSWCRMAPEGAVFFDPPPQGDWQDLGGWGEPVYYVIEPGVGGENGEMAQWSGEQWVDGAQNGEGAEWNSEGGEWPQKEGDNPAPEIQRMEAPTQVPNMATPIGFWNPNATEFVPSFNEAPAETTSAPANKVEPSPKLVPAGTPTLVPAPSPGMRMRWGRTPTPSPMLGPLPSPALRPQQVPRPAQGSRSPAQGPLPSPAIPPAPPTPKLALSEESPDVNVSGAWLEWSLPDPWGKLSKFPKDFCITSPMFGVRSAANMQLAFYPNGSRTAEAGLCTVSLTRGPDSAGIKFEFLVNGRGIGPKVCLGRRYLGDYPKPFGDSEGSKDEKVVVRMQVLKIL
mmetsp:Transcript_59626/g.153567  ORF Transcript_59626/g.153567 Transcript_59626/m.153567 type:complete len:520 (+) Transcript_59626:105-1664(+)